MDIYPLNLVLALALAAATVFLGALPTRLLRLPLFRRQVLFAGVGWILVGLVSPGTIFHYHVLFGLICLWAWWQLRRDEALSGKLWFILAAGLGISLGVVLILAVTPGAFPAGSPWGWEAWRLASLYAGGAIPGLAWVLYIATRREATAAGIAKELVERYAGWLPGLILGQVVLLGVLFAATDGTSGANERLGTKIGLLVLSLALLPALGWMARARVRSPAPSTSAPALLGVCLLGFGAEILALFLAL